MRINVNSALLNNLYNRTVLGFSKALSTFLEISYSHYSSLLSPLLPGEVLEVGPKQPLNV